LEQLKNDVCYSDVRAVLVGISAGVSYGALGSTHHSLHDFAALRAIHNISIVAPADLPDDPIPSGFSYHMPQPVLFGHYWMSGIPTVLAPHASCLDFSIAKGGVLTAYRWSGEPTLKADNLVWVS